MKDLIDAKLTIYGSHGVSSSKLLILQDAVRSGLEAARSNLGIWPDAKIRVWIVAKQKHGIPSQAYTGKKFLDIQITKKYLNSRNAFKKIGGTVIHEYVHFVRLLSGHYIAKTVLEAAIEEGIAIYIQSKIVEPPSYLEIKKLDEDLVQVCWNKLSEVIDKPFKKYPQILKNEIYRAIYYRLGFGIIRKYISSNRKISLAKLIKTSEIKLVKFAKKAYNQ